MGSSGKIGTFLRRVWADAEMDICWQSRKPLDDLQSIQFCPVSDPSSLSLAAQDCDVILNLAGVTSGSKDQLRLNTDLAISALNAARTAGVNRVILISSAAVYGGSDDDVSEIARRQPVGAYGLAKCQMEDTVLNQLRPDDPFIFLLRLGNVVGADSLPLINSGRVGLDQLPDGRGPLRSYIGPQTLADVIRQLIELNLDRLQSPMILNIAATPPVHMEDLLKAAQCDWHFQPAPKGAIPRLTMDTAELQKLVDIPADSAAPDVMIDQVKHLS
nr:NAD(P)-dependent oxidoreductase [Sulfitobacter algicola]